MLKNKNKKITISEKTKKRIKYDLILILLTAILLIVSTYSWFTTLKDLYIDKFQITVRAEKGLEISFDGKKFEKVLTLDKNEMENYYLGNTNKWPYTGLKPVSTAGTMDINTSRVNIYKYFGFHSEDGGGYNLTTYKLNDKAEEDGYLVFDLFILNNSGGNKYYQAGSSYIEDIELIENSYVRIETDEEARSRVGPGQKVPEGGDGIENAIRVGFFEIGRVDKAATQNAVTSISCVKETIDGYTVTPLCNGENGVNWNIWEPNDNKHIYRAKNYFDYLCKKRTGLTSYGGYCDMWSTDQTIDTYAVNDKIVSKDRINMYDGLNGYTNFGNKLKKMKNYTDSVQKKGGENLLSLGMNSITKIRVYVYLEGQDVDAINYERLEKKIKIEFGFSKGSIFDEDAEFKTDDDDEDEEEDEDEDNDEEEDDNDKDLDK